MTDEVAVAVGVGVGVGAGIVSMFGVALETFCFLALSCDGFVKSERFRFCVVDVSVVANDLFSMSAFSAALGEPDEAMALPLLLLLLLL